MARTKDNIDIETEIKFALPQDAGGAKLRKILVFFQGFHGQLNEIRDEAQFEKELIETMIDATEAQALLNVAESNDYKTDVLRKAKAKHVLVNQGQWSLDDDDKSVIDLKRELAVAKYRVRRAASRLRELETAIDVIRSALAWDRQEFERTD